MSAGARDVRALYRAAAPAWASGAELVYLPLAHALVRCSPDPLAGEVVLDVGAGTGAGSQALVAVGARPVAIDVVPEMLAHRRADRPPSSAGDVRFLPVRSASVAAAIAPFVLNHVDEPVVALRELARTVRPGGVVLASTFSEADRPPVKDQVDAVAARHGWEPSASYCWVKTAAAPLLGSRTAMEQAAGDAGLVDVSVVEGPVDSGVRAPEDLVRYRLGQAHVIDFLAGLSPAGRAAVFADAVDAVRTAHDGSTLAPNVVLLAARRRT